MEVLLVLSLVVLGAIAAWMVWRSAVGGAGTPRGAFRRTPLSQVAACGEAGVRRLAGTARALGEPPASEASGRPWLARELRIVAGAGDGGVSTRGAAEAVDFLLDDGSGVALVRASGGRVAIARDFEAPRTTLDRVPWADALLRAGGYRNGSPQTCSIRIYEGVLEPGGRAGVVGWVEPADAAARALGADVVVRAEDAHDVIVRAERAAASASAEGSRRLVAPDGGPR